MSCDPLSDILSLIKARGVFSVGLKATGQWAIRVEGHAGLKFNAVLEGRCWLLVANAEPVLLKAGDCFLLSCGAPFTLATDLDAPPRPAAEVFSDMAGHYAHLDAGPGNEFASLGGSMEAEGGLELIVQALPAVVVLPAADAAAKRVRWLLDRLDEEFSGGGPGHQAITGQIMQMIFVEMIRALPGGTEPSWLGALSDQRIGRAVRLIHADPARSWRLEELASACNLSRSQFVARFSKAVGMAPIDYLLHWRMALARRALTSSDAAVTQIAADLGYRSESAFGAAFKRVYGTSPRRLAKKAG
ncbi:AraC family transcriptional regulator [Rhizobiaceae bacterium n13]|uniref:AraC family transcriptional regulator n=1 Tax=Ferirhizobium litorale TaxID=2927786 RepID=A0AAE3U3G9_9HYPH|nr:AraC family transcriptional regulator [Fererhizobium litorale]MDI7864238.1 AraC family transcriptional regulator [Fererhizobium litorale]MDI7925119.1 AraC family transcriptional regulator [Fererhizobium litorale]